MDKACPRCGEEMADRCEHCGQNDCALCGCPSCEEGMPGEGETEDDEL